MSYNCENIPQELKDSLLQQNPELVTPAKGGGSNVKFWNAKTDRTGDITFRPAAGLYILLAIPALFAVIFFLAGFSDREIIPMLFSLIPAVIFVIILRIVLVPPKIDFREQTIFLRKKNIPMDDIQVIQFLPEYIVSRSKNGTSRYYSYEINLILKDNSRVNLIDQGGNREKNLELAQYIASAIQVPLWNVGCAEDRMAVSAEEVIKQIKFKGITPKAKGCIIAFISLFGLLFAMPILGAVIFSGNRMISIFFGFFLLVEIAVITAVITFICKLSKKADTDETQD